MVEANLKIIAELKNFIDTFSKNEEFRSLVTNKESDFSRNRKLPFKRLVGMIINMPKRSLSIELQEFFEQIEQRSNLCTKGAFCSQRTKIDPLFFQMFNQCLVDSFYHYYGDQIKLWRGFRLQAVDGSTVPVPNKPDTVKHFGTHENQHVAVPMARIMQIQDILNDITVKGDIFPIAESEQSIMLSWVRHLSIDSLTLFDRGYPNFSLMYLMLNEETPRHFVMRCKSNFNKEVERFLESKKRNQIVYLKPNKDAVAKLAEHGYIVTTSTTLKVRIVQITLSSGEQEILLTSLYDQEVYSRKQLYHLYGLRWKIETTYDKQKNKQQMEQFSGHRIICIRQDYAATLLVANLQSLIEKQCQPYLQKTSIGRKYQCQINRNISFGLLKHTIVKLFLENEPLDILLALQKSFEQHVEPIRPNRKYERVKKSKHVRGKYHTLTNYKRAV
jgi:Transposase DDE domain